MLTLFDQNYVANSYLQDMAVVFEIKGAVEMCQEFKVSADEAVNTIAKRFELSEEASRECVEAYWNR